ncbi:MAG: hypothetical protein ACPH4D_02810, partial [Porticoccaceae bacterium]
MLDEYPRDLSLRSVGPEFATVNLSLVLLYMAVPLWYKARRCEDVLPAVILIKRHTHSDTMVWVPVKRKQNAKRVDHWGMWRLNPKRKTYV